MTLFLSSGSTKLITAESSSRHRPVHYQSSIFYWHNKKLRSTLFHSSLGSLYIFFDRICSQMFRSKKFPTKINFKHESINVIIPLDIFYLFFSPFFLQISWHFFPQFKINLKYWNMFLKKSIVSWSNFPNFLELFWELLKHFFESFCRNFFESFFEFLKGASFREILKHIFESICRNFFYSFFESFLGIF